jgi:DNA (cytosine-5)-methyltransferase 1
MTNASETEKMTSRNLTAIDLFAGAGGFTQGATMAGANVLWAANHWQAAVDTHAANHPGTEHACQDLAQADFSKVPDHDLLLASPACQGHSKARGAERSHHDALRSTAWAVIAAVEAKRPSYVLVENVEAFLTWELFDVWQLALERYGYNVTTQVLNSADFGVPQERERAFVMATQGPALELTHPGRRHVALGEIVDLAAGKWSLVSGKCPKTQDQVRRAREKHGDTFAILYNGSRNAGRSLDLPAATVTTVDRMALVNGGSMRMLTLEEYRAAMGFPTDYALAPRKQDAIKLLGNAVCPPVAADLVRQIAAADAIQLAA